MDPRISIIDKRLSGIKKIVAVSGGKGGVGKSSVSTMLALNLADNGYKTGLLDLDLAGHTTHLILNSAMELFPKEEKGLIPPNIAGVKYMSMFFFSKNGVIPFRGGDISNAIIEILTITIWGELDFLIIDMPPGIGDATLDAIRLLKKIVFLLVATPSVLSREIVKREISVLKGIKIPVIGMVYNFASNLSETENFDTPALGCIAQDSEYEEALGDIEKLRKTEFYTAINKIKNKIFSSKTKKIVVVDDCNLILKFMYAYLTNAGYEVKTIIDSSAFFNSGLEEINPDLFIVDINMPEFDGFYIIEKLKELKICPNARILMCSTKFFDQDKKRAIALGADDFLEKPFDKEGLLEKVEKVLAP